MFIIAADSVVASHSPVS